MPASGFGARTPTGEPRAAQRRPVREPVAIIGMGGRFPGAQDADAFWKVLADGVETVGDYPGGRFPYIDQIYTAGSPLSERIASQRGGFLPHLDQFDAEFFGISPREAALLDPQQRLLLEVAWEAVDDAGLTRDQLAGTRTGVYVGVWTSDYEDCLYEDSPDVEFHATTGGGRYGASGRLAYFLDLRGPNLTVDTACSSSLVAIHLACQSLVTSESTLALAGGVNTILRPEITLVYSEAGMLAPDGRCKFGDAAADGYVRSEGAGIVVLKLLSQAIKDGDPIYAVIRGSAVNNDGQSSGLLVSPSPQGQEDVIRSALASAGMTPDQVDYVEAHGTGTLAGDPVEIETIGRVMASSARQHPCAIGSVKTNIGHTESAAGVAGVMKVALALNRGVLPPSLHFRTPSPRIAWDQFPVTVPSSASAWPAQERLPVAGVSGFGITGTNAHAILEGVPATTPAEKSNADAAHRPFFFTLSAQTPDALRAVAQSWRDRLASDTAWPSSLADLAYTATLRRTHHTQRLAIAASTREMLDEQLASWIAGDEQPGVASGERLAPTAPHKTVFVFPGQGGQWIGMGRQLYEHEPVFRETLMQCDAAIQRQVGWSVIDALMAEPNASRLSEIDVVQPALFAVMIALADLWKSLGVEPAAVVGHSMGEAAAAVVAGALSLDDGAAVICHRSRLMKQVRGQGLMAVTELTLDDARALIAGMDGVWIGASNSATSTVLSGDAGAVDALVAQLEARDIFTRRIQVDVASHSGHMDAVRGELESALAHIQPRQGSIRLYSTTTGAIEDGARLDAAYWGRNLRQSVLFHGAVEQLLADGFDTFIELNAHPVLTHALSDTLQRANRDAVVTGSLRRDSNEQLELLSALGRLYVAGYPVAFERLVPRGQCVRLPAYPWQRERHWFEPSNRGHAERARLGVGSQAVSGARTETAPTDCVYEAQWVDAPASRAARTNSQEHGHWIVLANTETGAQLAQQLIAAGDTCTVVHPGIAFRETGSGEFEANPTSDEDLRQILAGRVGEARGVIHAWSVSSRSGEPDLEELTQAQSLGALSAACVTRVLAKLAPANPVRLWLITNGMQQAQPSEPISFPTHATLAGLGRAIAQEHPELPCTNLDLSATPSDEEWAAAVQLIREDRAEQQMAVRGTRRLAARYRRVTDAVAGPNRPPAIHADATYLVTGGLGGIGLLTAQWLAARGARTLVLAGRKAPTDEARAVITNLEAQGVTVHTVPADIAEPAQVARLADTLHALPPLRGVFHLAATVDDRLLVDTPDESYLRLLRPKMAGAWNLYRALDTRALDLWVSFSSIAAVVTLPGQGAYATANAFLDGLARYAVARGVPMHSLQWGPWANTGLAHEAGTQRAFTAYAAEGIQPMSPEQGINILAHAIGYASPVVLTASIDWARFGTATAGQLAAPEFSMFAQSAAPAGQETADTTTNTLSGTSDLRSQISTADTDESRIALIESHLREQLAAVLKTSVQRIDPHKPMGSMGVDSLLALELVRRLSRSIGVKVPATVVFNYPTIAKLAVHLDTRIDGQPGQRKPATPATLATHTQAAPATDVHTMSDEDALRALVGDLGGAS